MSDDGDQRTLADLARVLRRTADGHRTVAAMLTEHSASSGAERCAEQLRGLADAIDVTAGHIEQGRYGAPDQVVRDDWSRR